MYLKPKTSIPVTNAAFMALNYMLASASGQKFPVDWYGSDVQKDGDIEWFIDEGMDADNGVMGLTSYLQPRKVWLCPSLASLLDKAKLPDGRFDVGMVANTVFHELTHLRDMQSWWKVAIFSAVSICASKKWGVIFLGIAAPIYRITMEKRAEANGAFAEKHFALK